MVSCGDDSAGQLGRGTTGGAFASLARVAIISPIPS